MPFLTQGKTNWKFIGIVVILAVIFGGGMWFLSKPTLEKPIMPEEEIKEVTEEVEVSEEIIEDATADWQTYRNEEYGFEVKYPRDWTVKEDTLANEINFGERGLVTGVGGEKIIIEKIGFSVGLNRNVGELWGNKEEQLSLENWISKTFLPLEAGEVKEFTTFGIGNYKGVLVKKFKSVGVIRLITRIFAQKNSFIYEIKAEVPTPATVDLPTKYNYEETFNQILSTFRFLD